MWLQSYIDDQLRSDIGGGYFLTSIAIIGHGCNILAQSFNFPKLKPNEVISLMNEFDSPGSLAPGFHIEESGYYVIRGEPGAVIRGKGKKVGLDVTVKKTTLGLIIGMYDARRPCCMLGSMVVEEIGDYLIQQGL